MQIVAVCSSFLELKLINVFMSRFFCGVFFVLISSLSFSQNVKIKERKYPSLLWEITGNGLKKPSYLFGTMHVSSKMVFNLSDSFYRAIHSADVVALETNPESWQDDMFNFNIDNDAGGSSNPWLRGMQHSPDDYLTINTLKFSRYEKLIEQALASNPSAINNLLYRTYSDKETDFEEDTYLDLYIYQAGKKWGKKVVGVEKYAESMKLAMEAYVDGMKDKNRKERSYDVDEELSYSKLQEAYRTGNLDLLDTINRVNSFSDAFDEKFLFRRNEIQAVSIDSIIKNKMSLFVGVGAAHLPGQRGVIEILRQKGYKLRPIKMGERSSRYKDEIEKIKVPVNFSKQVSEDGFYKVEVPGKLYRFSNSFNGFDQQQYADMANGSYYVVTRIQTNASAWGDDINKVFKKVDSLLYENIPGRILTKQIITRNGYKGFDIVNRTRRGDYQRYNIFITPFEALFFKVSGNGEYVKTSSVDKFFASIELKEYKAQWKIVSPAFGGFEIEMPHDPYVIKNKNWQFLANDKNTGTDYEIIRTDIHNYNFVEEDSFDLGLMEESYTASDFFDKQLSRKQTTFKGYPALDAKYQYKDGSVAFVRYLIQGPHYYTISSHAKNEHPGMMQVLNSFTITPFVYKEPQIQKDTSLYFTVNTPWYPAKKNFLEVPGDLDNIYASLVNEDDDIERPVYKDRLIENDSTGEKIYISFYKKSAYEEVTDTAFNDEDVTAGAREWLYRMKKESELGNGIKLLETIASNSNSTRAIWTKLFNNRGAVFTIQTQIDTLTRPSSFITQFFQTFQPFDTVKGSDVTKSSEAFFADFYSNDTVLHKKAIKSISGVSFDTADLPQLKRAIASLGWKEKNYLKVKNDFIEQLGMIESQPASLYLKDVFYAAGDTVDLQYAALKSLLNQQTKYSYSVFRDIVINDPPVINLDSDRDSYDESFLDGLYDSLQLTASIIKDIFPLIDIDDYKYSLLEIMSSLVDSNLISYKDYEQYVPRFLIEAKQALKKQTILEKNKAIEKAKKKMNEDDGEDDIGIGYRRSGRDNGNETLSLYATLLMSLYEKNAAVAQLLQQLLLSNDQRLRYNTALLFLRNNRSVADSIINFYAAEKEYRYELYNDLKDLNKQTLFPVTYNNQVDLALSKLYDDAKYHKPDTMVFVAKKPLYWAGKEGFVYFFKYKRNKEDVWKIASAGLLQKNDNAFEFEKQRSRVDNFNLDFTSLSDTKLKEDEPVDDQLNKRLRQLIYSKRSSAKEFYRDDEDEEFAYEKFMK